MKNQKVSPKLIGGIAVAAVVILALFLVINNIDFNKDGIYSSKSNKSTEVSLILEKDLDRFYPSSARETVRLYERIYTALVNETYSEEEFYGLVDKMRTLFDDELLAINEREKHITSLYDEISARKNGGEKVASKNVQQESQAQRYETADGDSMTSIVGYFLFSKKGKKLSNVYQEYILREDEDGNWKILGWKLTDPVQFAD